MFLTCSCCASFDIRYAIDHALMEAEASVLSRLKSKKIPLRKPREINMPIDHGLLYSQKEYFHRADFLTSYKEKINFRDIGQKTSHSWQELINLFNNKEWQLFTIPLFLDKKYGGNGNLHIIRSIIPGIIPMTFGYRREPAGMKRIYKIAKKFKNKTISYRDLSKFPHPFM